MPRQFVYLFLLLYIFHFINAEENFGILVIFNVYYIREITFSIQYFIFLTRTVGHKLYMIHTLYSQFILYYVPEDLGTLLQPFMDQILFFFCRFSERNLR